MLLQCNIKTLPGKIGQLAKVKDIKLKYNELECLPKEFCSLPSDAKVYLDHNPISDPPYTYNVCHPSSHISSL